MNLADHLDQNNRLDQFLHKFSPEMAASFTEEQRQAITTVLAPSHRPRKRLDLRKSFVLLGRKYYFVILFGKDRRTHQRARIIYLKHQNTGLRRFLSMGLAGGLLMIVVLSTIYLVTAGLGVNLFPHSNADNMLFSPHKSSAESP
ncbi:MAG: hypothetical protein HC934_07760 [Acaryochloridaceae cyanobacterium SU_2_1]|nr:hypothetical protein [Acaryochloridaceae cyanobacterium SU_2_1]